MSFGYSMASTMKSSTYISIFVVSSRSLTLTRASLFAGLVCLLAHYCYLLPVTCYLLVRHVCVHCVIRHIYQRQAEERQIEKSQHKKPKQAAASRPTKPRQLQHVCNVCYSRSSRSHSLAYAQCGRSATCGSYSSCPCSNS